MYVCWTILEQQCSQYLFSDTVWMRRVVLARAKTSTDTSAQGMDSDRPCLTYFRWSMPGRSDDSGGNVRCQVLMGHHVRPRDSREARMKESVDAIAPPSINHCPMTGTRSVSHALDPSDLHFVASQQLPYLLSKAGATLSILWFNGATAVEFLTGSSSALGRWRYNWMDY